MGAKKIDGGKAAKDTTDKQVMASADITRSLKRLAFEIVEKNAGISDLLLMGIPTRGVHLARRLASFLAQSDNGEIEVGVLDITLYRDDLARQPARIPGPTSLPENGIDGKTIVLVDDVLYSGRTIRAALDALIDLGRPRAVQLAVLVDRGHRELPIRADYVGKNLPTSRSENVQVFLSDIDNREGVYLSKQERA